IAETDLAEKDIFLVSPENAVAALVEPALAPGLLGYGVVLSV
ncbi:hypothetical protein A2U01_0097577, partial [Trifolium medium]|nr:hypothetical protein [Trifolium medium]